MSFRLSNYLPAGWGSLVQPLLPTHQPATDPPAQDGSPTGIQQRVKYFAGQALVVRILGALVAGGANTLVQWGVLAALKNSPGGLIRAGFAGSMAINLTKANVFPALEKLMPELKYDKLDGQQYSRTEMAYVIAKGLLDAAAFGVAVYVTTWGRATVEQQNHQELKTLSADPSIALANFLVSNPMTMLGFCFVPAATDYVHYVTAAFIKAWSADTYVYESSDKRKKKAINHLKAPKHWVAQMWGGDGIFKGGNEQELKSNIDMLIRTGITVVSIVPALFISRVTKKDVHLQVSLENTALGMGLRFAQQPVKDATFNKVKGKIIANYAAPLETSVHTPEPAPPPTERNAPSPDTCAPTTTRRC